MSGSSHDQVIMAPGKTVNFTSGAQVDVVAPAQPPAGTYTLISGNTTGALPTLTTTNVDRANLQFGSLLLAIAPEPTPSPSPTPTPAPVQGLPLMATPTADIENLVAVAEAEPGDVVLVAGKGHETTQTVGTVETPFDDRIVLREALAAAGWTGGSAA